MLSASMITWLTPTISDRPRRRQQHAPQLLAAPCSPPCRRNRLISCGTRDEAEHGGAHHRRRGEDAGGEHRRDRAVAEQQQHRDEIGEGRDRLHQVERRRDDQPVGPRRAPCPDAEGSSPVTMQNGTADRRSAPASAWRCPTGRTARCRGSSRPTAAPSLQPPRRVAGRSPRPRTTPTQDSARQRRSPRRRCRS